MASDHLRRPPPPEPPPASDDFGTRIREWGPDPAVRIDGGFPPPPEAHVLYMDPPTPPPIVWTALEGGFEVRPQDLPLLISGYDAIHAGDSYRAHRRRAWPFAWAYRLWRNRPMWIKRDVVESLRAQNTRLSNCLESETRVLEGMSGVIAELRKDILALRQEQTRTHADMVQRADHHRAGLADLKGAIQSLDRTIASKLKAKKPKA